MLWERRENHTPPSAPAVEYSVVSRRATEDECRKFLAESVTARQAGHAKVTDELKRAYGGDVYWDVERIADGVRFNTKMGRMTLTYECRRADDPRLPVAAGDHQRGAR